jgi:hypothetical protein
MAGMTLVQGTSTGTAVVAMAGKAGVMAIMTTAVARRAAAMAIMTTAKATVVSASRGRTQVRAVEFRTTADASGRAAMMKAAGS